MMMGWPESDDLSILCHKLGEHRKSQGKMTENGMKMDIGHEV
jgi:hypothetical protein